MKTAPKCKTLPRTAQALLGGLMLAGMAGEASAQFFPRPFVYGGYYSGPIVAPLPRRPIGLDIADIFDDLEARGFKPLGVAARRPGVFVIDAIDTRNQQVRLVVDAYDGDILERFARPGDPNRTLSPDPRKRDALRAPRGEAQPDARTAEIPAPPRRPAAVAPSTGNRPAPVAPARDPSLWAPAPATPGPVAPLE